MPFTTTWCEHIAVYLPVLHLGRLACFQFLSIMNNTTQNIFIHIFSWTQHSLRLCICPGVELLTYFSFNKYHQTFSLKWSHPFTSASTVIQNSASCTSSPPLGIVSPLEFNHSGLTLGAPDISFMRNDFGVFDYAFLTLHSEQLRISCPEMSSPRAYKLPLYSLFFLTNLSLCPPLECDAITIHVRI